MKDDTLKLLLTTGAGTQDATALMQSCTWAGNGKQVGRTLDVSLTASPVDKRLPVIPCSLGDGAQLFRNGELLFDGFVFSRDKDTGGSGIGLGCFDRGIYLKRNEAAYLFTNQTPESITRRVCGDFGISVGALASTGVPVSRNFPGVSLYKIIQTGYTLAAEQTGGRYQIRFRGAALEVVEKKQGERTLVLRPGSNLISASVSESVENMVNQVAIYDKNGARVSEQKDGQAVGLYGLMQAYLQQAEGQDTAKQARRLLEDGAVSQTVTVSCLGNPALIAGECVVVREPYTGVYGLFWIDADTHTWKNGLYQCKLTLNFRNLMDEQEAGKLLDA